MSSKKILFIVAHRPGRSPGQRFRFEQYLDLLSENGFYCEISNIISEEDDRIFYQPGNYLRKFAILIKSLRIRYRDLRRIGSFDIVFIYREAIMLGSAWFERRFKARGARIIFDFDDAIWLLDVSQGNNNLGWLKRPSKTNTLLRLSDCIFAGNRYLAEYARKFNGNVKIVPTTLDTGRYKRPAGMVSGEPVCIGWTGSSTTLKHFSLAIPIFRKIRERYGKKVVFKMIADVPADFEDLDVEFIKWNKETEIEDLCRLDIGIMALPDDEWARGKCGFKGLQYMALEIPAVMSPVGVNTEIINDGVNGFLAGTTEEWTDKLSRLIDSHALRRQIGQNGRNTVLERYSYQSQALKYLSYFNELIR